jgi:hypothetical protein
LLGRSFPLESRNTTERNDKLVGQLQILLLLFVLDYKNQLQLTLLALVQQQAKTVLFGPDKELYTAIYNVQSSAMTEHRLLMLTHIPHFNIFANLRSNPIR